MLSKKRLSTALSSTFRRAVAGLVLMLALTLASHAFAGPRSGASFGGRTGFRSGGGFSAPRSTGYGYRGGTNVYVAPSYGMGWGWGHGYGYGGYGGGGMFSPFSLLALGVLGIAGTIWVVSRVRRYRGGNDAWGVMSSDDDRDEDALPGRAYVYRLQLALGRSARGIQDRLTQFAEQGDAETEDGLASLLQQTALELLREKDSIRYAAGEASGPISLTNAETKLNTMSLAERSRFQVERLRGAGTKLHRSEAVAEEGREALEYVVVTVVVATRNPLGDWTSLADPSEVAAVLSQLGGVSPAGMLGLEVIWTPADPHDSMTETDLMTTYPDLRSL
jgi:uncharacterized membrane protein